MKRLVWLCSWKELENIHEEHLNSAADDDGDADMPSLMKVASLVKTV